MIAGLMAVPALSYAVEGMWQPNQLPQIAQQLKQKGLEIDPSSMQQFDQFPMNAIVSLGGCSASFISPKGLVVTNHHCAYGSIGYNSTQDNNLLKNGFVAKSLDQELPARPGSRMYIIEDIVDVTDKITGDIDKSQSGKVYFDQIEDRRKALVAECEEDKDYRCSVRSFHAGLEYYLIKSLTIKDVRLAYAPSDTVGKFGGDTDNWMWPRHTGDWAMYRAYVGPDGRPADHSEDNIPYQPKSFLKVNADSIDKGDFVMALGFPGSTNRYRLADTMRNTFTWAYPTAKQYREEYIDVIKAVTEEGSDERIKYQSTIAGLANYAKNYGGMINSYQKSGTQVRKDTLEQELLDWINASTSRKAQYGDVIAQLNDLIGQQQTNKERDLLLGYIGRTNLWSVSKRLYRLAHERTKDDAKRKAGYQERDLKRIEQGLKAMNKSYVAKVDKAVMLHFLEQYAALDKSERVAVYDEIFELKNGFDKAKVEKILDNMHSNTQLDDVEMRMAWMNKSVEDFKNSDDPYIQFAVATFDHDMNEETQSENLAGEIRKLMPQYMQALIAYKKSKGEAVYADANSTLRITFGTVQGYSPQDGLHASPFTTLEGMLAKYIPGDAEFDLQESLLKPARAKEYGRYMDEKLGTIPLNFLCDLDTTGGNSGSAIVNGKGELIGLLFDGVYESIIGDWDYDQKLNRSIGVTSTFMLWTMEHVDGAENLINEMRVVND
ncbi:S46 family peptidase [Thalassotalea aquiviva]|uniref:S46 family peptidase n=1 Tax=Thalassotalea aquiviva TaxID=3242415 RepID=UPI00352B1BE0